VHDDSIFKQGSNFFIGPKQAVVFKKFPDARTIERVERAFNSVQHDIRKFVSDETVLGVIAYLMGIREVRWFVCCQHYHHGSNPSRALKLFVAMAHAQFARGLYSEFKKSEFLRYWAKYRLILIREALKAIF